MISDAELLSLLTPIAPEAFDPVMKLATERAARDGVHLSLFAVPSLRSSGPVPEIVVAHFEPVPPIDALREEYEKLKRRCRPRRSAA